MAYPVQSEPTAKEQAERLRKDARLLDTGMDPDLVRELHAEADKLDPPAPPYEAQKRGGGFWLVIDTRTGEGASYPTSEAVAKAEARTLNTAYAEAIAS